ncbi:MAG: ABC transporter substrate-binding protein [Rhodobacteraceae bacterium]|nr:ABC transporter substrate-binding protein [Paracoccaceae bacterium]
MPKTRLKTVFMTHGHTAALKDGRVSLPDYDFDFEEVLPIPKAFRRMIIGGEFEVSEMAMTTYLCAKALGAKMTALPIFLTRGFHHRAIVARPEVSTPKDLEGKVVGVNRGYTVTTSLWARAILAMDYGVDLSAVQWRRTGLEHVPDWVPPANVGDFHDSASLEDRLASGEAVAATGILKAPGTRPLINDAFGVGLAALRDRGFYPLNHALVIRDDVLAALPDLPAQLFDGFVAAKRLHLNALKAGQVTGGAEMDEILRAVMEVQDDPLPYGIAPNAKMLEVLVEQCLAQAIIPESVGIEGLFAPGVRELVG